MIQLATQHDSTSSLTALDAALGSEGISEKLKLNIKVQLLQHRSLSSGQRADLEEEIYATVMKRAVENRHRYDASRSKPITWLNGMACFVMKEQVRELQRFPRSLPAECRDGDTFAAAADNSIRRFDDQDWFEQVKRKLTVEERTLLDMSEEDMDSKTMAAKLGISHGAVRVRESRLFNKLRNLFNNQLTEERS